MNKRRVFKKLRSPEGRQFFIAIANDLHATLGLIPDGSDDNLGEYLVKRLLPRTYIAAQDLNKEKPATPEPLKIPNQISPIPPVKVSQVVPRKHPAPRKHRRSKSH